MKRVRNKRGQPESGVVAVEFAIIAPLLALMLVGIIEVGLLARDHQIIQNAAREGANFAARPINQISALTPAAEAAAIRAAIRTAVIGYAANEGITLTDADITLSQTYDQMVIPAGTISGQTSDIVMMGSEIIVTYDKPLFFKLFSVILGDPVTISSRSVFANLY